MTQFLDELGLIEELLAPSEAAEPLTPDFSSTSEFISSLPSAEDGFRLTGRDAFAIANTAFGSSDDYASDDVLPRSAVAGLEDRRLYHPDGKFRAVASVFDDDSRIMPSGRTFEEEEEVLTRIERPFRKKLGFPPQGKQFFRPSGVSICAKRKIRREVLAARMMLGFLGIKRYRRSWLSRIGC